ADLASLEAQVPQLMATARAAAFALALLLAEPPDGEWDLLAATPAPVSLAPIPVGERASLLRRRPDVLIAERELAAATAEIGVATAELFPRLVIGAHGGFQSLDTGTLFDSASQTWSILPSISWRIFDGGRTRAGIRAAEARAGIAALAYERAVLGALNDAERALSRYLLGLEALDRQRAAVAAAERSYGFAELRYRSGETALLELLDAERVLRGAEDTLAAVHTTVAVDLVSLYKALGGGWSPPEQSARAGP
ncbi:MAG TPA: TolC family protein, partial [Steroidobacteraceae bacterium]|nr:TolC family protein [Steroidobacteraceae bacterium]